ncbi:hypothetical protein BV898_05333 [Hypsibius exemplaris]|uniref:G-protein coupled receptors family 1 profile domain-containing protein n=1 Tax=Hypsibius exemplaris TaxID=2072580 RepID=A0A1W0X005_HYPEX|nr:hypothetical protein BV898_05333 [Hypsibius exemplaris]
MFGETDKICKSLASSKTIRPNFLADPADDPLCQIIAFVYYVISPVDQLQHATLAFHRFFAIVLANRFVWLRSRACTAILVAVPWLFLGIIGVLPFFHVGVVYGYNPTLDRCFITRVNSWAYIQFNKVFFIVFSLASIAFCYTSIAVKVGMTRRRAIGVVEMSSRRDDSGGIPGRMEPTNIKQQNKKGAGVTKTVIALCLLFVISFLPWMIYPLVAKTDVALNTPQGLTVVTLYLFGCAASPWLIVLLTPALRNHVNRQFHRIGSSVDASWALQQRH